MAGRPTHTLFLPGETAIPFVPEFEFLYGLGYVIPVVVLWGLPDVARLMRLARSFAVTLAVAYATYLLFPVYFKRPALEVHSVATRLLAFEYLDRPYNDFPSLHVAIGTLVWLACHDHPRCRGWLAVAVVGMSIGTLFVKQHYVVDVVSGAMLALAAWWVAGRRTG